jgi:hypothetical protein
MKKLFYVLVAMSLCIVANCQDFKTESKIADVFNTLAQMPNGELVLLQPDVDYFTEKLVKSVGVLPTYVDDKIIKVGKLKLFPHRYSVCNAGVCYVIQDSVYGLFYFDKHKLVNCGKNLTMNDWEQPWLDIRENSKNGQHYSLKQLQREKEKSVVKKRMSTWPIVKDYYQICVNTIDSLVKVWYPNEKKSVKKSKN